MNNTINNNPGESSKFKPAISLLHGAFRPTIVRAVPPSFRHRIGAWTVTMFRADPLSFIRTAAGAPTIFRTTPISLIWTLDGAIFRTGPISLIWTLDGTIFRTVPVSLIWTTDGSMAIVSPRPLSSIRTTATITDTVCTHPLFPGTATRDPAMIRSLPSIGTWAAASAIVWTYSLPSIRTWATAIIRTTPLSAVGTRARATAIIRATPLSFVGTWGSSSITASV